MHHRVACIVLFLFTTTCYAAPGRPWPELKPSSGVVTRTASRIYIQLSESPADGKITLPLIGTIEVRGKTMAETRQLIHEACLDKQLLHADADDSTLISVYRKRS